ncbi:hypothetical protein SAMN05720354_10615 [Nitrosospira sp. Nsp1]|nr:hypothetical protein SAMN05720354_10615 [Nitrosospira sp. Nsp1]
MMTEAEFDQNIKIKQKDDYLFSLLPYEKRVKKLKEKRFPVFFYKYHSLHSCNPKNIEEKWDHLRNIFI